MFGSIGLPEILFIFVLALLIFGPKRLPKIGRSLGKAMGEFRRATNDLKRTWDAEAARIDLDEAPAPSTARYPAGTLPAASATPAAEPESDEAEDEADEDPGPAEPAAVVAASEPRAEPSE